MSRRKDEFVRATGTAFEILKRIVNTVAAKGGNDDDLRRILSPCGLADRLAEAIVASRFTTDTGIVVSTFMPVTVDRGRTFAEMLQILEIHDGFDPHHPVTANDFRYVDAQRFDDEVAIVEFRDRTDDKLEILDRFDKSGLQPATIEHSFAFAERYPDMTFGSETVPPGKCELSRLVVMGTPIVRVDDGVEGYPFLHRGDLDYLRYISLLWRLDIGNKPLRYLVTRKKRTTT